MKKTKKPNNLDYYSLIGEFIVEFNFLEQQVAEFVWSLARLNKKVDDQEIARIIFKDFSFSKKIEILLNLFEYYFGKQKEFTDFCGKLKSINIVRNNFIHSLWFVNFGSEEDDILKTSIFNEKKVVKKILNKAKTKIMEDVTPKKIKEQIQNVKNIRKETIEFHLIKLDLYIEDSNYVNQN